MPINKKLIIYLIFTIHYLLGSYLRKILWWARYDHNYFQIQLKISA